MAIKKEGEEVLTTAIEAVVSSEPLLKAAAQEAGMDMESMTDEECHAFKVLTTMAANAELAKQEPSPMQYEEAKAASDAALVDARKLEAETNQILQDAIKMSEKAASSIKDASATTTGSNSSSSSSSNIGWWVAGAAVAAAALYGGYQFFSDGEEDVVLLDNMDECL